METDALRKDVLSGKVKIDDLKKRGMGEDEIRELLSGRKAVPGEESPWGELGAGLPKLKSARPARPGGVEARHRGPEAAEGEREVLRGAVHRGGRRG